MTLLGPVIIEPGTFTSLNLGDLAMLQVAICRLRMELPSAELRVFTQDADALEESCPGTLPLSDDARRGWYAEHFFLGAVHSILPRAASQRLAHAQHGMRRRYPRLMRSAMRLRAHTNLALWKSVSSFLEVMERASIVVVAGQHTIADAFYSRARNLLDTLETAILDGIPTVMLGQGIGPLTNRELVARARAVLPAVDLIAVREPNIAPPILRALGVADSRIFMTGDDAVAPAFAAHGKATRESLGVSLRATTVAGVHVSATDRVGPVLRDFAASHGVSLVPLPSAFSGLASDELTLGRLLGSEPGLTENGWAPRTVPDLIAQVGRCRVVVAGAYHVAVFALAQGIPVVALARSTYYRSKYDGLESLFGSGCETLVLDDGRLEARLRDAMERAWERADDLRSPLLAAAERQVRWGEEAFARAMSLTSPTTARPRAS
ncbi:MAG TPA: polysaccharide pyruvyl transferase family protein [Gemmatimonadaceae bacterium]|nr:polysaccharide pyruvyl transferase family protein [Gemmatimonadaceae bacterium]